VEKVGFEVGGIRRQKLLALLSLRYWRRLLPLENLLPMGNRIQMGVVISAAGNSCGNAQRNRHSTTAIVADNHRLRFSTLYPEA